MRRRGADPGAAGLGVATGSLMAAVRVAAPVRVATAGSLVAAVRVAAPVRVAAAVLVVTALLGTMLGTLLAPSLLHAQGPAADGSDSGNSASAREGHIALNRLPLSTRSLALAGALPLVNPDSDLFLRNPALAERGRGMGLTVHGYEDGARLLVMTAGMPWLGGGVGLGLRHATYLAPGVSMEGSPLPHRRSAGNRMRQGAGSLVPAPPPGERPTMDPSLSETALTAGYGRLFRGFRLGAALSALEVRRGSESETTAFLDAGVARDVGRFTLGLSGGGLGPGPRLPPDFRDLPAWGTLAAASQAAPVGPLDIAGAFALTWREGGEVEAGGGVEVGWWPVEGRTLTGRLGVGGSRVDEGSPVTLGAAFLGDAFTLEYAWRPVGGARGIHGVSLRFR